VAQNSSVEIATRLVNSVTDLFFTLGSYPDIGRRRSGLGPDARSFPAGNYIVYYRRRKGGIEISRVIHGRRHQGRAMKSV
jgi:toxin ParE1/3/4